MLFFRDSVPTSSGPRQRSSRHLAVGVGKQFASELGAGPCARRQPITLPLVTASLAAGSFAKTCHFAGRLNIIHIIARSYEATLSAMGIAQVCRAANVGRP